MGHWASWGKGFCNGFSFFGPGSGFLGFILSVLIWGFFLYGIVMIFRHLFKKDSPLEKDSALETLRIRYASGEISHDEFFEMKTALSSK